MTRIYGKRNYSIDFDNNEYTVFFYYRLSENRIVKMPITKYPKFIEDFIIKHKVKRLIKEL